MKMEEALQAILRECMKLPESERNTPDKASMFAIGIMQDRPDLTKFKAIGDPYQHINAYLCHHLLQNRRVYPMAGVEHKNLSSPDETRTFGHGKAEIISIGGGSVGRLTLERGWRWSQDVKPIAKTEWCEAPHFHYQVSGRLHVVMQDGTEFDTVAGDVVVVPSGHDAWVVGDESVVLIDWHGATNYAKQ